MGATRFVLWVAAAGLTATACQPSQPVSQPAASAQPAPGAAAAPRIVQPGPPGQPSVVMDKPEAGPSAAMSHTAADTSFMQGMIHHHQQAIEMVDLLKTRTQREDMRLLGQRIEVSQTDEIRMMKTWLTDRGEAQPMNHAGMEMPMMPGMLTKAQMAALAAATGPAFDRLFLTGMIQHHEGALVMVDQLFRSPGGGLETTIFDFATHVDADQRMDISRMRAMLKEK